MRLTNFSDYSFRVLLYAAAHSDRLVTIQEMVDVYKVSRGHLNKVVHLLTTNGFLEPVRGRGGGLRLAKSPKRINLGKVLRLTETDFNLVECFLAENKCCISRSCRLPGPLNEAAAAFIGVFDKYTLADMQIRPEAFLDKKKTLPRRGPRLKQTAR